ncbi:hypothetical protein CS006_07350 [Bifidobacterium primatium]|uniref:ATP-binding protein n=1 Tax=Bifidobacterium primatium TaxID=2045438 RepID=A0A2M9H8B3_9BIFI|nr:hypothetical protein [Bifidobacterium primatium]PJM73054.1 hypothetical protein CS006_07350 [Bifidobacterium primatium]
MNDNIENNGIPDAFRSKVEKNHRQKAAKAGTESDDKPKPASAGDLIQLAHSGCDIRRRDDGRAYAVAKGLGVFLDSDTFRGFLSNLARRCGFAPAHKSTMEDAILCLQDDAKDTEPIPVHLRVARTETGVWIDNIGQDGRLVHIANGRWSLVDRGADAGAPVFERPDEMRPLPVPSEDHGDRLDAFWEVINCAERDRGLLAGWMVYVLTHESNPFPLLLLDAEQGSGKSSSMNAILELVDPSGIEAGKLQKDERDTAIVCEHLWCLRYDNISSMDTNKQDMFCRISTGGGYATRSLYRNRDLATFRFMRPVVMNSISLPALRPDLAQRTVRLELPRIPAENRQTDAAFKARKEQLKPMLFGCLLSLCAKVEQMLETEPNLANPPRMADYAATLHAIDQITGWNSLDSYRAQQRQLSDESISEEPIALALEKIAEQFRLPWEGTSKELLEKFPETLGYDLPTWKSMPQSAGDVTRSLKRCAQSMRAKGWTIDRRTGTGPTSGTAIWHIKAPAEL